jgi:hypothetical protein
VPDPEEVRHCARCDAWTWFTRPAGGPPFCTTCGTPLAAGRGGGVPRPGRAEDAESTLLALAAALALPTAVVLLLALAVYLARG